MVSIIACTGIPFGAGFSGIHQIFPINTRLRHNDVCSITMASKTELPVTWSNRLGLHLTPIATGLWAAERTFIWNSIDVGGRSVIARMPDGTLLVHSPVEWTEELGTRIDLLGGGVGHIVSPNYEVISSDFVSDRIRFHLSICDSSFQELISF